MFLFSWLKSNVNLESFLKKTLLENVSKLFEKVLNRDKTTEVITYCPDCMLFAHELMMCLYKFRLRHRGPDWSGLHCHGDCYLAHQRLAIVDPASGDQPLYNEDETIVVTVLFF